MSRQIYEDMWKQAESAAGSGDWDRFIDLSGKITAAGYGRIPQWDHIPQYGMPDKAVHHVLDNVSAPGTKKIDHSFLFEYAQNIPQNASPELLSRVADAGKDDQYVTSEVTQHPNYRLDARGQGLLDVANFWHDYERKVKPEHFATVKSLVTGKPEELTNHRGERGSSEQYMDKLQHFPEYAKRVQEEVAHSVRRGDIQGKHTWPGGKVKVKVYRGLGGDYAQKIRSAVNFDPGTKEMDRKSVSVPVSNLSSWTTDPDVARTFAGTRDIHGQAQGAGLVIQKWMPLEDLLHSGAHNALPAQPHAHEGESELVFRHDKPKMTIKSSDIVDHQTGEMTFGGKPKVRKPVVSMTQPKLNKSVWKVPVFENRRLSKAEGEDEIMRMWRSNDPAERRMATKMGGVTPAHINWFLDNRHPSDDYNAIRDLLHHEKGGIGNLDHVARNERHSSLWEDVAKRPDHTASHIDNMVDVVDQMTPNEQRYNTVAQYQAARAIAASPHSTPEAIHRALAWDGDRRIGGEDRLGVSTHKNADPDTFRRGLMHTVTRKDYSREESERAKHLLRTDPRVDADQIMGLPDNDGNRTNVAGAWKTAVMSNPYIDHKHIDGIINKEKLTPGKDTHLLRAITSNPALTDRHLHDLIASQSPGIAGHAVIHPNIKPEHLDPIIAAGVDHPAYHEAIESPKLQERHLEHVFNSPNTRERTIALKAKNIPERLLDKALNDNHPYIRGNAANHPSANADQLIRGMLDSDEDVTRVATQHPRVSSGIIDRALASETVPSHMYRHLVRHPQISSEGLGKIVDTILADPQRPTRDGGLARALAEAASNPRTPIDTLQKLVDYDHSGVLKVGIRHALVMNPNLPAPMLDKIAADRDTKLMAIRSPNATVGHIKSILDDPTVPPYYRQKALEHPNTPADVLENELKNPNADPWRLIEHPNATPEFLQGVIKHPNTGEFSRNQAKDLLALQDPDSVHKESVLARVGQGGLGRLRKLRDFILSKEKKTKVMHPRDLPKGDWSAGRLPNGNISADKIQEYIDQTPGTKYNVSHSRWDGGQRHNNEPSRVFQLNITNDHVQKMKGAGVWSTYRAMQQATRSSNHPVTDHSIGWVRWTGALKPIPAKGPHNDSAKWGEWASKEASRVAQTLASGGTSATEAQKNTLATHIDAFTRAANKLSWGDKDVSTKSIENHPFIQTAREAIPGSFELPPRPKPIPQGIMVDEVQSDFGLSFVKQAAGQARGQAEKEAMAQGMSEEEAKAHVQKTMGEATKRAEAQYPEDHYHKISQILFNGRHPNEVISEAFIQHLRDKKAHNIPVQWHTVKSKAPISLSEPDKKVPGHFQVTYNDVPKKLGMEPSTYGKLPTQDNKDLEGVPTFEGKVRKFEEELSAWILRKTIAPEHLTEISNNTDHGATDRGLINTEKVHQSTPEHVKSFKTAFDHAHNEGKPVSPINPFSGSRVGISAKKIFSLPSGRAMLKPFYEVAPPDIQQWAPHPLGGWAELTSQALYDAAGLKDHHQKSHIYTHKDVYGDPLHSLVVHFEKGYTPVHEHDFDSDPTPDSQQKVARHIGIMDFLAGNWDRHANNLMYNPESKKVLAIDHSNSFQYSADRKYEDAGEESRPDEPMHEKFAHYWGGKAPAKISGDRVHLGADLEERRKAVKNFKTAFGWWKAASPAIRSKMAEHLEQITDPVLKDHVRKNFEERANWLDNRAADKNLDPLWANEPIRQYRMHEPPGEFVPEPEHLRRPVTPPSYGSGIPQPTIDERLGSQYNTVKMP